jgi:hypothetical protein
VWQNVKANVVVTATYTENTSPLIPPHTPPHTPPYTPTTVTSKKLPVDTTKITPNTAQPVENNTVDEDTTILKGKTPQGSGETEIDETETGTGKAAADTWSLFDLICALIAAAAALAMLIVLLLRRRNADGENAKIRRPMFAVLSAFASIAAIILVILTQDLSLRMAIFDEWSIAFAIVAIIGIVAARLTFGKKRATTI